jgi:hypothetical protein
MAHTRHYGVAGITATGVSSAIAQAFCQNADLTNPLTIGTGFLILITVIDYIKARVSSNPDA